MHPLHPQSTADAGAQAPPPRIGRLRAFTARRLNPAEKALARGIFGDSLPYERIRLVQLPRLTFGAAVPFGRTIFFSRWRCPADFTGASLREQAWFIHELAHLWQARRGVPLMLAKLFALGKRAYRIPPNKPFSHMNIEAQAETARLLFLARAGAAEPDCPLNAVELEMCWR